MPHIELKVYPGYDKETLEALADSLVKETVRHLGVPEGVVSLAMEEVSPQEWQRKVFQPFIQGRDCLIKAPRY